ncbi:MAG: hypothetical protein QM702_04285 [Rubrivivax sp.]
MHTDRSGVFPGVAAAINALGAAISAPTSCGESMTDEWLELHAERAAWIASASFEDQSQYVAFLRGFANRVLLSFGQDPAAAMAVPFSGRIRGTGETVKAESRAC